MLNPDQSCICSEIRPARSIIYLHQWQSLTYRHQHSEEKDQDRLHHRRDGFSSEVPNRHREYLFVGLKMAPKWIDLSECMQCFKPAGQSVASKLVGSCRHISSLSLLNITLHLFQACSLLPPMTDTDAGNPPTNPFVCTPHPLPQIALPGEIPINCNVFSVKAWIYLFPISSFLEGCSIWVFGFRLFLVWLLL